MVKLLFFLFRVTNSNLKNIKLHFEFRIQSWLTLEIQFYFCPVLLEGHQETIGQRKAFSLISSRDHCQRSSSSRISNTPRAGFELAQNLSSDFVEWSCAVVITTTPRRHLCSSELSILFSKLNLLVTRKPETQN